MLNRSHLSDLINQSDYSAKGVKLSALAAVSGQTTTQVLISKVSMALVAFFRSTLTLLSALFVDVSFHSTVTSCLF